MACSLKQCFLFIVCIWLELLRAEVTSGSQDCPQHTPPETASCDSQLLSSSSLARNPGAEPHITNHSNVSCSNHTYVQSSSTLG